jgi:hypothetical protein
MVQSRCRGRRPVTAKVDGDMEQLLQDDAELLGVYRSEIVRLALDEWWDLRMGEFECPHCSETIQIEP